MGLATPDPRAACAGLWGDRAGSTGIRRHGQAGGGGGVCDEEDECACGRDLGAGGGEEVRGRCA